MKNTTTIILTILLLSAIGVGAYYWQANNYQIGNYQNQISNLQQQLNEFNKQTTLPQSQLSNLLNNSLPNATQKHYTIKDDYLIETSSGKKLLTQKIGALVDPEAIDASGYTDPATEWLQFTYNNKVYLYVERVRGCGGCAWTDHYFEIDPNTDKAVLKDSPATSGLANTGVISPNKTLVAYVKIESNDWGKGPESIWIFDLINRTNKKVLDLPSKATAISIGDGWSVDPAAFTWNNNTSLTINPFKRPRGEEESDPAYYTRYGEQWTITI